MRSQIYNRFGKTDNLFCLFVSPFITTDKTLLCFGWTYIYIRLWCGNCVVQYRHAFSIIFIFICSKTVLDRLFSLFLCTITSNHIFKKTERCTNDNNDKLFFSRSFISKDGGRKPTHAFHFIHFVHFLQFKWHLNKNAKSFRMFWQSKAYNGLTKRSCVKYIKHTMHFRISAFFRVDRFSDSLLCLAEYKNKIWV